MARDFNENRNVNAILGQANIDKYGKTFAVQYGLDGINVANVTVEPAPLSIVPYLEGDDTITKYAVPINVDTLCDYALASFPNIEEITLFSLTMVTFDETNLLSYLPSLETVYVPQNLLTTYQSTYPNITFEEITEDYTYVIEDTTQDHVLTSDIVTEQLNALTSQQKNAITKLVIASSYTSASVDNVLWGYNFGTLLPYLNNNIWYNGSKFDFTQYTIQDNTQDHILTASVVETELAKIGSDKLTAIEKIIVPVDFTSYASGSITELQAFMNTNSIDKLVTTYDAGEMELSLSGDIVAKIVEIGKTLDEALVYARSIRNASDITSNKASILIVPPTNIEIDGYGTNYNTDYTNAVLINMKFSRSMLYGTPFRNCYNLIEVNVTSENPIGGVNPGLFVNSTSVKRAYLTIPVGSSGFGTTYIDSSQHKLEKLIMNNWETPIGIIQYTSMSDQSFADLFNSLGTPDTQQTITLSSTDYAKLTNADIQLLYDKNWKLSPTPSAFSFDIGSDTYSCDFGMTWNTWLASGYNVDGYSQFAGYVIDSNGNYVKLNGENVSINSMIKYGDTFDYEAYYGQFEYQGTLPTTPNRFSAKYYSDSACTNEVLVVNLVIGTTYYYTLVFDYGTNFATDSWDIIKYAYDNGLAQYSLGDTKLVTYNNNTYTIRICDIGARYDLSSGNGKNKATFEFVELTSVSGMNYTVTNNGGWALSYMKNTTMVGIYNNLPSDLKEVISQVSVASASDGSASGSGSLSYSDNYLFLASNYEIFGLRGYSNAIEQTTQYGLYQTNNTDSFRIKSAIGGSAAKWWLRSPYAGDSGSFCSVSTSGSTDGGSANYSRSVSPFFCI